MQKNMIINLKNNENKIIGALLYIFFLVIVCINFYTKLIHEDTCGPKSKILFVCLFTFVSVLAGCIIVFINKKNNIKPEKIFLVIATTMGIIYLFATPLFKGHDEQYHWYKSYAVSLGKFKEVSGENGVLGDFLPRMVDDVFEIQGFFTGINYKTSIAAWKYSIFNKEENDNKFIYNAPTAVYPPIQMAPQAIGIFISRLIGVDTYTQGIFGRLGNLCFFIIMGYFSIKNIPTKKYFLVAYLLSPKIMYISSTMSGDVFTNSIIIFFISYIMRLRASNEILTKKEIIILLLITPCVAVCKAIYFPICFMIFMLPKEKFKNSKDKLIKLIGILLIAISFAFIWTSVSKNVVIDTTSNTPGGNQLSYVLSHPISYIGVLIRGVCDNFIEWSEDIVGGNMEWGAGLTQPTIVSAIVYMVFIIALANEEEENEENKLKVWEIILITIAILIVIAGALSAMYIQWTPNYTEIGGLKIIGVQGRYFVPIMLLIALLIPKKYIEIKNKLDYKWIYIIMVLCEVFSLINIFTNNI